MTSLAGVTKAISLTCATLLMANCMEGEVSAEPQDMRPAYSERTAVAAARITAMEDLFALENQTLFSELPSTGTVNYSGLLGMNINRGEETAPIELIGDMTAEADFAAGTMTGDVVNFQAETDDYLPGALTMTTGAFFSRDGLARINTEFTGSITLDDQVLIYTATGDADLTGRDLDYFAGEAEGSFTLDGEHAATGVIDYALERNN